MKKMITLVLALMAFVSVAQHYNNTYDINLNTDNLTPAFVITNKAGESISVSYGSDGPSLPRTDYFIITKLDAYGGVIYNNRIDAYSPPTEGFTHVEALWLMDNGKDVLISGYWYGNADHVEQPFLIKVDADGVVQWSRIYFVNDKPMENSQYNKISLIRVYPEDKENYFIVASGDSDYNPGADITTNVIKVDQDGKMIWSKKYYDQNPNPFNQLREYPGDIKYSKKDKMFMITGRRIEYDPAKTYLMYFFGINNDGKVVTKYLTLESKSIPTDQDMIYDPNKNWFATTFTHSKSDYVTGYYSQIGFIAIDAAMNLYNPKYIWHKYGYENNGRSIVLCKDGNYVIGADVYDNVEVFVHNPAWLKVDPSGVPVTSTLFRYNIKDDAYFGHHVRTYDPMSGSEQFAMVNEQKTDMRVIRTDAGGKACGAVEYKTEVKEYDPKVETYKYDYKEKGDYKEYKVWEKKYDPEYRKCEGDGTSYRTAAATGIAQISTTDNSLVMYPTVLSADNAVLTVVNNAGAPVKMEIRNIAGQLIYTNSNVAGGTTQVQLGANGTLSQGLYLVNVYDANGALSTTSKIVVTK